MIASSHVFFDRRFLQGRLLAHALGFLGVQPAFSRVSDSMLRYHLSIASRSPPVRPPTRPTTWGYLPKLTGVPAYNCVLGGGHDIWYRTTRSALGWYFFSCCTYAFGGMWSFTGSQNRSLRDSVGEDHPVEDAEAVVTQFYANNSLLFHRRC